MSTSEIVVIIRPSFMKFCQDGCKAAAFNHALYWIAYKARGQTQEKIQAGEVTWYATTEEFTEQLANAWGVCKVRQAVNSLIDMGIIGRGRNIHWGADRTKHFFFGKDQCAKLFELCQKHDICLFHLGLQPHVLQMINLSNASGVTLQCTCKQMIDSSDASINLSDGPMDLSNANDESIEAIPKDSTKVTSKNINKEREDSAAAENQTDKPATTPPAPNKNLNEKIEQFRNTFITLGEEMFAYDKFTANRVQPNSDVHTRILEIIGDGEVSPEAMRRAFLKLWNHKDKDGTHWWRDKSRLTLKAFVNNYDDQDTQQEMNPYVRAVMQSAGQLTASTPGSQYIVDALEEVAQGYLDQHSTRQNDENEQEAYESFLEYGLIHGKLPEYWTEEHIEQVASTEKQISIRLLLDEWKKGQQLITTGPLAGQPRYDADPWL